MEGLAQCACLVALDDVVQILHRVSEKLVSQCQAVCLDPKTKDYESVFQIFFAEGQGLIARYALDKTQQLSLMRLMEIFFEVYTTSS